MIQNWGDQCGLQTAAVSHLCESKCPTWIDLWLLFKKLKPISPGNKLVKNWNEMNIFIFWLLYFIPWYYTLSQLIFSKTKIQRTFIDEFLCSPPPQFHCVCCNQNREYVWQFTPRKTKHGLLAKAVKLPSKSCEQKWDGSKGQSHKTQAKCGA